MQAISNDKEGRRYRRERNMVAKNNKHKGGYHTPAKFERKRFLVNQEELNEWWEHNV
mgnify:CR=1 FL=1|jgi:hypothetical protein